MTSLLCSQCLLAGKKIPAKLDHIGDDRYAPYAKAVFEGDSLCESHLKEAIHNKKRKRP